MLMAALSGDPYMRPATGVEGWGLARKRHMIALLVGRYLSPDGEGASRWAQVNPELTAFTDAPDTVDEAGWERLCEDLMGVVTAVNTEMHPSVPSDPDRNEHEGQRGC